MARHPHRKDAAGQMHLFDSDTGVSALTMPKRLPEADATPLPISLTPTEPYATTDDRPTIELRWDFRTSFPQPLESAIEAGRIFDEDCEPEAIAAIHDEHAREVLATLEQKRVLLESVRLGLNPETGKPIRTEKQRERLLTLHASEPGILDSHFNALIDVYAEVFGDEAAQDFRIAIHAWHNGLQVRCGNAPGGRREATDRPTQYGPGHPWHYYREGDASEPCPVEAIPPGRGTCEDFGIRLPADTAKRRVRLESLRIESADAVAQAERRYQELIDRGVEALSSYDRQIAYGGNDDLAWASSIALAYNQVRFARGKAVVLKQLR